MINHQLALIKREVWEHRSIYVTPAAIASIVTLGVMAMLVFASGFAAELDVAIFGAQNLAGEPERKAVLTAFYLGTSWIFIIALAILTVFYCLDSLYAERKDKSILFWRSLPITDAETVISKLLTAIFVLPLATVIGIIVTHLINLIVVSIWVSMKGGDGGTLIWGSVALFDNWLAAFHHCHCFRYLDVSFHRLVSACFCLYQAVSAAHGIHAVNYYWLAGRHRTADPRLCRKCTRTRRRNSAVPDGQYRAIL